MECLGPPSAAPWTGRSEVGQGDAIFKNSWTLSELDMARMTLIFDTVVRFLALHGVTI